MKNFFKKIFSKITKSKKNLSIFISSCVAVVLAITIVLITVFSGNETVIVKRKIKKKPANNPVSDSQDYEEPSTGDTDNNNGQDVFVDNTSDDFDETMPKTITASPNMDYSGKTVGVLVPQTKPAYYKNLISTLKKGVNAKITEIDWKNVSTALNPKKVEAVIIPSASTVPYGIKTAVSSYLNNGGKLLTLGGVPFEESLYSLDGKWVEAYEYMKEDSKTKGRYIVSKFDRDKDLTKWGRNNYEKSGEMERKIGDFGSPTKTNCLQVKLNDFSGWDTLSAGLTGRGYKSLGFWAKGDSKTKVLSIEVREADGARWYTNISLSTSWTYYVLGPSDFTYWPWDSSAQGRGEEGDVLNMKSAAMLQIGLSGSFSPVAAGDYVFYLDDVCFLNYEKPVEDEYVLEGLSPDWKYYPINNGKTCEISDNQVFVADRDYKLPKDIVSLNSGTLGTGFASGKQTRFVPLIEVFDSKELFSGCLAWMNINSSYASDRPSNGSITACFGTDDPKFYNKDGLAAVLDTVRTLLNDTLFTEAGTSEYIYVESETSELRMGGYVRGESMSGVTMDIDLAKDGKRIAATSFDMNIASPINQFADNLLTMMSVDYSLSQGKPDTVMITLKKDGTAVDRIVQEMNYWNPKPLSERHYITKKNGEFYQNGKILRIYGVNFLQNVAAVGFDAEGDDNMNYHEMWWSDSGYDPEKSYRQLQHLKDIGFNAVSINGYVQEAEQGLNLLHFIDMCDDMGIYVDCFVGGADGISDYGGAAKRIIELEHLADLDNIIAYDIAWERTHGGYESGYSNANGRKALDTRWIEWVIKNYGSVAAAEKLWKEDMSKNSAGEYTGPTDSMLTSSEHSALVAAFRRFADEYLASLYGDITSLLKTADPNHMFSSRAGAPSGTAMYPASNMVYDAQGLAAVYDFYSPEFYDEGVGYDKRDFNFVNLYAQYAMPDSPVVWKEFGESVWSGSNFLSPTDHVTYSSKLKAQANTAKAMLDAAITTHATAVYTWLLQPGYRIGEISDCGVMNPDGSDRPVTKIFREYRSKFMNQPTKKNADVKITVDRDLSATGWKDMYISIKDNLLKNLEAGKTVALVDKAVGKTTANVSNESVGNCGNASSVNPARYVNGIFSKIEVQGSDGTWQTVTNGTRVTLPKGKVKIRITTKNVQRSKWVTSGTGAVSIVSAASSDVKVNHAVSKSLGYLKSSTEEFVLINNYTGKTTNISLRYNAKGRFDFGTPVNFTIS